MYSSDASGRLHPVASAALMAGMHAHAGAVDRHALAAMADDVAMAARVAESAAARLSPHVHAWARHNAVATGGDADEYAPRRSHHSSSGAGASAPLGFASDRAPALEAHECVSGLCVRPFPPLLVESCIQRYGSASSSSSDTSERTMGALQLSELFIAQCVQLLHGVRFLGGRDLFDPLFLHDIDDMMRAALWRGEAKGRKAAEEALGRTATAHDDDDDGPAPSPRDFGRSIKSERSATLNPSASTSTSAASAAAASSSVAHAAVPSYSASERARQRRATQDDALIHHPFAPAAYEAASSDGAATARLVGSGSGGYAVEGRSGRGLSRRAQGAAAAAASQGQRPRQCLLSSLLGLIRFTNALATRLKYWRGQLKAKQKEIATLTAMAAAAAAAAQQQNASSAGPGPDEAAQQAKLTRLSEQVASLEAQLARAHATLHEYESSGRARSRYEPTIGDTDIPFGLQGQLNAARLGLEESRSEVNRLAQEKARHESEWEQERAGLVGQLSQSRSDAARLREESISREHDLAASVGERDEHRARVSQLEAMLDAVKQRVASREAEWEGRMREWEGKHQGHSCGPGSSRDAPTAADTVATDAPASAAALAALREDLAREKAHHAASRAAQESEWHTSQTARDKQEQTLRAEAARARQAHASALREYEQLRQENSRVQAAVDAEKSELEAKLRRSNTSLAEARNTIAALKAQLKRAMDQPAAAAAAHPPAPELPSARLGANSNDEQQQQQRAQRKREADALRAAAEAKAAAQEEAEQRMAQEAKQREAQAAAEKIKAAAAARKKAKKAEAQAAAAAAAEAAAAEEAAAAAAAAATSAPEADKPRRKKKQRPAEPPKAPHPLLAPPTALELSKPTPKLSSGYGRCVYEPGEWYEGWWVNYERSGQGTYQWRDGRRYDGDWLSDKKHGQGRYSWPDGDRFEGAYADDKMHGWGTYVFSDGTRYEGEWARDMSHGRGTFHYADSARFEGNFDRDQKHGPGLMFLPSGECFSEHWVQGKRISSISVKQLQQLQQGQQQQQQQQRPVALRVQSQPPMQPPPAHAKNLSRIRLAAAEQLQMAAAASARGSARR